MKRTWNLAGKGWLGLAAAGVLASCLLMTTTARADDSDIFRFPGHPQRAHHRGRLGVDGPHLRRHRCRGPRRAHPVRVQRDRHRGDQLDRPRSEQPDRRRLEGPLPAAERRRLGSRRVPYHRPYPTQRSHVFAGFGPTNRTTTTGPHDRGRECAQGAVGAHDLRRMRGRSAARAPQSYRSPSPSAARDDNNQPPFSPGKTYRDVWQQIKTNYTPGNNPTPMSRSLEAARNTFFVNARTGDGSNACRKKFVVLVTDGEDTVGSSASASPTVPASSGSGAVPTYYVGGSGVDEPDGSELRKTREPADRDKYDLAIFQSGRVNPAIPGRRRRNSGSIAWAKNLASTTPPTTSSSSSSAWG